MRLMELLTNAGNKMISNVLSSEFIFDDVMQLLMFQKPPYKYRDKYVFSSSGRECYQNEKRKALISDMRCLFALADFLKVMI